MSFTKDINGSLSTSFFMIQPSDFSDSKFCAGAAKMPSLQESCWQSKRSSFSSWVDLRSARRFSSCLQSQRIETSVDWFCGRLPKHLDHLRPKKSKTIFKTRIVLFSHKLLASNLKVPLAAGEDTSPPESELACLLQFCQGHLPDPNPVILPNTSIKSKSQVHICPTLQLSDQPGSYAWMFYLVVSCNKM